MSKSSLSVAQALDRLLATIYPLSKEQVPLLGCLGRVLAQDVVAIIDLPPFSNSAMDGYAVRAADVIHASSERPVTLTVVGDDTVEKETLRLLGSGEAMPIMTGGPLPPGSDAVLPVEFTSDASAMVGRTLPDRIEVLEPVVRGDYLREVGQDVRRGTLVLQDGHRLRPQDISMMAALGISNPSVYRRPMVAILSTGDELLEIGEPLIPGHLRDANSYGLAAAVQAAGAVALRLGIAVDQVEAVVERLDHAVEAGVDLIISSAGVSMGVFDFVRSAIEAHGELSFWRVNLRPGKPIVSGSYRTVPFLGLPGNPVSALVTFQIFAYPVIARLSGSRVAEPLKLMVRVDHALQSDGRESYLRAKVRWEEGEYRARLTGSQDSGVLSSLVAANALLVVPADVETVTAGEILEAILLGSICHWVGLGEGLCGADAVEIDPDEG